MVKTRIQLYDNLIISFGIAFILGFFAPLDFLYSNLDDLWLDVYNIIGGVLGVSIGIFGVVFGTLMVMDLLPFKNWMIGRITKLIVIYFVLALYMQGNYIRVPYGALDGTPIVWNEYMFDNITSIIAWIGVLALIITLFIKTKWDIFIRVSRVLIISLVAITTFTLVFEYGFSYGMRYKNDKMSTTKNEWVYSKNKNVNILLLDYFDSRLMTELLVEDEEVVGMIEDFDGFTFFRDTLGCYNLTDYAIPLALTGKFYLGNITYGDYANVAYSESLLFSRLRDENWDSNIYTTITLPQGEVVDMFSNVSTMRMKPKYTTKLIKDFYGIVGFRYAPTPCKKYFYDCYRDVGANKIADNNYIKEDEESLAAYDWNNALWYDGSMEEFDIVDTDIFHFYHLHGVHPPRQYFSDFRFTTNPDEVSLEEGAKLGVIIAHNWIERLKEEGVYDNSVIIIMADHGSWEYKDGHYLSQTPLMLIKGYDEHHEFQINEGIPVSFYDLQQALMNLMDGKFSLDCFDDMLNSCDIYDETRKKGLSVGEFKNIISEDLNVECTNRIRPYFFIYLMNEMGTDSVGGPFYEGYTEYPAYEPDYMIKTGVEYK